jgi:hypothetical protein
MKNMIDMEEHIQMYENHIESIKGGSSSFQATDTSYPTIELNYQRN